MSVRVLLAAVVTVALIGSAVPAIEAAQEARVEHRLTTSVDRIRTAATGLARHSDPVPPGVPGARRRVHVDLPEGAQSGSIRIVSHRNGSPAGSVIVTRVDGERRSVHPVGARLWIPPGAGPGSEGSLVIHEDAVLVLERRLVGDTPAVVVVRGFKPERRTSETHAGTSGAGR